MKKILFFLLFSLFYISSIFAERVIVFEDEYKKAISTSAIGEADHRVIRKSKGGFRVLEIDQNRLKKSGIKYIPDAKIFRKAALPNDPGISSQWSISNTKLSNLWENKGFNCSNIIVAVVDTGIDYTHEDLSGNVYKNSLDPIDGFDNDSNGYTDDYYGYDFAYGDSDPTDGDGHGSHVAGIIGAIVSNGKGIAGVCNVKLLAVKVLDDMGDGYISDVVEGIYYAADRGAKVINLSMEANIDYQSYIDLFNNAINYAGGKGSVIVSAAGNTEKDLNSSTVLPASLRNSHSNMLVVGAYNSSNYKSYFSNYGGLIVDLFAPGESIYSTFKNNSYGTLSGTSMATPFVSGIVAFLLSYEPNLNFQEIRNRIYNATTNTNFRGYAYCDGQIDLSKLFDPVLRPIITKISNINPAIYEKVTLEGHFANITDVYWNSRSISFNKINDYSMTVQIPTVDLDKNYGILKAVNSYGQSNSIVVYPSNNILLGSTKIEFKTSATVNILESGSYSVQGYILSNEGVKFYLNSTQSYVTLIISMSNITSSISKSATGEKYGILMDENGNKMVISSTTDEYRFDNVSTNKVYIFVEADGIAASASGGGGCFIATAAFGSYFDPHVRVLRGFRDRYLLTNQIGRWFVEKYYEFSPPIADYIKDKEMLKAIVRIVLLPIVYIIEYFYTAIFMLSILVVFYLNRNIYRSKKR
jgi:hypothetical protein